MMLLPLLLLYRLLGADAIQRCKKREKMEERENEMAGGQLYTGRWFLYDDASSFPPFLSLSLFYII